MRRRKSYSFCINRVLRRLSSLFSLAGRMALTGLLGEETRVLVQRGSASVSGLALALLAVVCAQMSVLL